jgi:AsmA-like C-terminal region/AsmA family
LRRLVFIAGGIVALAVAAYAALLLWYDGDRISNKVSERMLARHGIVLEFERVERSFAPRPLISLTGLRVANAEQRDRELVAVDTASFRVHPLSWFSGSVSLDRIQIDGLRFTIPVDDQGPLYWDPLVATVSDWLDRFDWSLRDFDVRNIRSQTRNVTNDNDFLLSAQRISGAMARPAELAIIATEVAANLETTLPLRLKGTARLKHLELGRQDGDLPVTLEGRGSFGGKPLEIEAAGGNLLEGDPTARDPIQARIALGEAVARMAGTVSRDDMKHLDLFVTFEKPGNEKEPELKLEFDVSDPDTRWKFSSIRASRAESGLTGGIEIGQRGKRRFFSGDLAATNVRYPEPDDAETQSDDEASGVLPEGDLVANLLDFLAKFDAEVSFRAAESTFVGVPFEQLAVRTTLDRGILLAKMEKASIKDADLSGQFSVRPDEGKTVLELDASVRDAPISVLIGAVDVLDGVTGRFMGELNLKATGDETSAVLGTTAGRLVLYLEDGEMPDELATRLAGDVLTAMFADFRKGSKTPIRCALVDVSVKDGLAQARRMIMDTGAFNLYGRGEVRLREQELDIELVPKAKDFSLVSMRLPLRFHGPFGDVKFDPDVSEGAESLLTPIDLGLEEDVSCTSPAVTAMNE